MVNGTRKEEFKLVGETSKQTSQLNVLVEFSISSVDNDGFVPSTSAFKGLGE
jgi:hypothetical protein